VQIIKLSAAELPLRGHVYDMFTNANYFLNFQKLLGIAKGVKVVLCVLLFLSCAFSWLSFIHTFSQQGQSRLGPTTTDSILYAMPLGHSAAACELDLSVA